MDGRKTRPTPHQKKLAPHNGSINVGDHGGIIASIWWDNRQHRQEDFPREPTILAHWKPDHDHLDSQESHGLCLGRRVAKTAWSTERHIDGKPIHEVTIADLAYTGMNNWYLRHISAGRFTGIEFTRSVKESTFIQAMLKMLRTKDEDGNHMDIEKTL